MEVRYHGHACFELRGEEGSIIFDPFLRDNPQADVGPEDVDVDGILVSHGHSDHIGDAVEISRRTGAVVVAPYELAVYCQEKGAKAHPMYIGGSHRFPFGWVKLVQATHGSSLEGRYLGAACGFVVRLGGRTVYYPGDTGLFGDMKLIGELYPLDIAFVPIGSTFTMDMDEAVKAVEFLKPKVAIPMHYNTFPVIQADPEEFARRLSDSSTQVVVMEFGESRNF